MSLTTPTIKDLNDDIIANLESSLSQTIPLLPKSFLRVLAKVLASVFILLWKYSGFMFLQIFVATASNSETTINGRALTPLQFWGQLVGVGLPTPASQAELLIDITVTNQTGSLPSNTQLIGSTNGVTYITLGSILLDAAVKQVTVKAVADQNNGGGSGTIGNLDAGATLSFANPLANVGREAVVDSQTVTGAEAESTEVYRERIIERFAARPQGGALVDYRDWGEEVAGIVNVYPYTAGAPGQVNVYSEATPESSGDPDGIPTAAQLQQVLDSINLDENGLASRRPANAFVNSLPITRINFQVTVTGLTVDDPATVQAQIDQALIEFFSDAEPFIAGVSVNKKDQTTNSAVGGIVYAIVNANGGVFVDTIVKLNSIDLTPTYTLGEGEKAKLTLPVVYN